VVRWKKDPEFYGAIKGAIATRLVLRLKKIEMGANGWQGAAWLTERLLPLRYSKPEVQISLSNSFNQRVNALSITVSPEEIREIEALAEPIRGSVRDKFTAYRASVGTLGNGVDGQVVQSLDDAIRQTVARKFEQYRLANGNDAEAERPLIVFCEKDDPAVFWGSVANASGVRVVERETAVHVVRTLLGETVGQEPARQAAETIRAR
jgi:hypothetical protein